MIEEDGDLEEVELDAQQTSSDHNSDKSCTAESLEKEVNKTAVISTSMAGKDIHIVLLI